MTTALLDGDILRYEIGFAAEVGWRAITGEEDTPPWHYVREMLDERISNIMYQTNTSDYCLYITEGETFRYGLAKRKPYKGTRVTKKPFHFKNLTSHMVHVKNTIVVTNIEADDALAIDHISSNGKTVLCSRDKDLRQVPGVFFSWELGKQAGFGPAKIEPLGTLDFTKKPLDLKGTGFAWFCAQVLMGDKVDNIPGLQDCGPRAAWEILREAYENPRANPETDPDAVAAEWITNVKQAYEVAYGHDAEEELLEQGRLCWITRRLNEDRTPELWEIGMWR